MMGHLQQVLVDYAHGDKPRLCPYALVITPFDGGGAIVERCKLQEHHKGPHQVTVGGGYDGRSPVTIVRVQWRTITPEAALDAIRDDQEWREGDAPCTHT